MKTFGLILVTLLVLPLPAQANFCETRAFSALPNLKVVGVESYPLALHRETTLLLQREITPAEISAIEQANHLKKDEDSSRPEGMNLRAKVQILKKAGFSKKEVRKLIENNIVWIRNLSPAEALLNSLKAGKENIYFSPPGPFIQPSRIHKVVQETDKYFEVSTEMLSDDGALSMETVHIRKRLIGRMFHPNTQVLFSVSKSEKPKINREDIKIPIPTQQEVVLQQQGFGPAWTKGLDKLNEWVAVRRQLQELKANPRTMHIPYFADQISAHLDFAKEGLGAPISGKQNKFLANLIKEAEKAILEEKVTYEWWLRFNYQISSLLSDTTDVFLSRFNKDIISRFPLQMAVPTTYGEVGIITLNRAQSEGIYPLGLINQPKEVDSQLHTPLEFINHDILHTELGLEVNSWRYSLGHRLKHKKMLDLMENLPTEKRKSAELVYFSLTHEVSVELRDIFFENQPREKMLNRMVDHFKELLELKVVPLRMTGLGKEYTDLKSEEAQIQYIREHIAEPFMQEVSDPAF